VDVDDQAAFAEQHCGAPHGVVGNSAVAGPVVFGGKREPGLSSPGLTRDSIQSATRTYTGVGLSTPKSGISGTVDLGRNLVAVKGLSAVGGAE